MKLGIISDCLHYKAPDGRIGTENHIYLRQMETLCSRFSATLICCPFAEHDATKVISYYNHPAIRFEPMPLVGGDNVGSKLKLISVIPTWFKGYKKIDKFSNIVYQRFPNNINIPASVFFWLKKKKVFATYTGTWNSYAGEPLSYRLQRWFLQNKFTGPVWVYKEGGTKQGNIYPGFSPSYTEQEWSAEEQQVQDRLQKIRSSGINHYRFITVGTLIDYKNQLAIVKACKALVEKDFKFLLTIVGEGPMRQAIEEYVAQNNLHGHVKLVGKKNQHDLQALYREHDFVVQAPLKEGFGKVPIEGFFHGVVPIINNISMARQMLNNGERGFLFDGNKPGDLEQTLLVLPQFVERLPAIIEAGRTFAKTQTLEAWANEYYTTITNYYGETASV